MFLFADYLRAIAVILITNSHYGDVYPVDIATGAELGMAVFFMLSGYLLSGINKEAVFIRWYGKRIARLFIPVTIVQLVELLAGYIRVDSLATASMVWEKNCTAIHSSYDCAIS